VSIGSGHAQRFWWMKVVVLDNDFLSFRLEYSTCRPSCVCEL
jgi:hypothetical protein